MADSSVADLTFGQLEGCALALMIEHQMQLKAKELTHAGLAPRGYPGKYPVPGDAPIVTYGQRCAVDVVSVVC